MEMQFPHYATGKVVKGFGRGSKQLGIPTANYPDEIVSSLPSQYTQGVYYGWAQVNDGNVYKMVMSIGDNPYFKNEKKTMVLAKQYLFHKFIIIFQFFFLFKETYIMNKFENDFYESNLKTIMTGYIRPMVSFGSIDELIEAIHDDIEKANLALQEPNQQKYKDDTFFKPIRITNF